MIFMDIVPSVGLGPTTNRLEVYCSSIELQGCLVDQTGFEPVHLRVMSTLPLPLGYWSVERCNPSQDMHLSRLRTNLIFIMRLWVVESDRNQFVIWDQTSCIVLGVGTEPVLPLYRLGLYSCGLGITSRVAKNL